MQDKSSHAHSRLRSLSTIIKQKALSGGVRGDLHCTQCAFNGPKIFAAAVHSLHNNVSAAKKSLYKATAGRISTVNPKLIMFQLPANWQPSAWWLLGRISAANKNTNKNGTADSRRLNIV